MRKYPDTATKMSYVTHSRLFPLQKPQSYQALNYFKRYYGIVRFITLFKRALNWLLNRAISI